LLPSLHSVPQKARHSGRNDKIDEADSPQRTGRKKEGKKRRTREKPHPSATRADRERTPQELKPEFL
jgi:hypothetical protein